MVTFISTHQNKTYLFASFFKCLFDEFYFLSTFKQENVMGAQNPSFEKHWNIIYSQSLRATACLRCLIQRGEENSLSDGVIEVCLAADAQFIAGAGVACAVLAN